jgi:hypothetical protein
MFAIATLAVLLAGDPPASQETVLTLPAARRIDALSVWAAEVALPSRLARSAASTRPADPTPGRLQMAAGLNTELTANLGSCASGRYRRLVVAAGRSGRSRSICSVSAH